MSSEHQNSNPPERDATESRSAADSLASPQPAREPSEPSTLRAYYESLIIVAVFVTFARIFVLQTFKIPTPSMEDNLLVGDHIIVNKFAYGIADSPLARRLLPFREIHRGDTIVFRNPLNLDTDYVKRVIGLPGEVVTIRNKKVLIDGRPIAEPYALFNDSRIFTGNASREPERSRDQFGPYTVPPGSYFAMGDNRDSSYDSRYWGSVPRQLIKGKPFLVYWSFRGEPVLPGSPVREKVKELLGVFVKFFSNTRWDRTFFIIDSRYHYQREPRVDIRAP